MPGSGTFEIKFDGNQLIWSLTTYDGTHKSSISSVTIDPSGLMADVDLENNFVEIE